MLNNSQTNETLSLRIKLLGQSLKKYEITKNTLSEFLLNIETHFMDEKRKNIEVHMIRCKISQEQILAVLNELPPVFKKQTMLDTLRKHKIGYCLIGALLCEGQYPGDVLGYLEEELKKTGQLDDKPDVLQEILLKVKQQQPIEDLLREHSILHDQDVIKEMTSLESLTFFIAGEEIEVFKSEFENEEKINELFAVFEKNKDKPISVLPNYVPDNSSIKKAVHSIAGLQPVAAESEAPSLEIKGASQMNPNHFFSNGSSGLSPSATEDIKCCYVM